MNVQIATFLIICGIALAATAESCQDRSRNCARMKKKGYCAPTHRLTVTMKRICKLTCGNCGLNNVAAKVKETAKSTVSEVETSKQKEITTSKAGVEKSSTVENTQRKTQTSVSKESSQIAKVTKPIQNTQTKVVVSKTEKTTEKEDASVQKTKVVIAKGKETSKAETKTGSIQKTKMLISRPETKVSCVNSMKYPEKHCRYWSSIGYCETKSKWFGFMRDHCRKTCSLCN